MLALPLCNYIRDVHPVTVDRTDDRGRMLGLFVGVGVEGYLRTLHREFSLVSLVQQWTRSHRSTRLHVLPIVFERRDEASLRPERDVRALELEPVLPPILRGNPLDPRQGVIIEKRSGVQSGRSWGESANARGGNQRRREGKGPEFHRPTR